MHLYNFCLVFGPFALMLGGAGIFGFGILLAARSRLFYSYIFIFLLLVLASQIEVGLHLDQATTYPPATLWNYALVDDFVVRLAFRADWFSYVFALPLVVLTVLIVFYLVMRQPLVERDDQIVTGRLYGLLMLGSGTALAALYSADLVMLYFWLEGLGLTLYLLAGPGLRGANATPSAFRAWGASWLAGLLILIPFLIIISRTGGDALYADISAATLDTTLFGLVVAGAAFKAAQFPFGLILNGQQGAGVYALFGAGALFPLAVYLPGRLQLIGAAAGLDLFDSVRWVWLLIGAFTLLTGGWLGLRETNLVRKTGWLITSQMGFVTLGVGVNELAMVELQLVGLAIFAPLMYICADLMEIEAAPPPPNPSGKGLPIPVARPAYFRPVLVTIYIIGAVGSTGLPLSPVYAARWQILSDLLAGERLERFAFGAALIGLALGLVLIGQSLTQFLNASRLTVEAPNARGYWSLLVPVLLGSLLLISGLNPSIWADWIKHFTTGLLPIAQNQPVLNTALLGPSGWFGLLLLLAGGLAYFVFTRTRGRLTAAFNGGLFFGSQAARDEAERAWKELHGQQIRGLAVPQQVLPTGFEDEFFQTGLRGQVVEAPKVEPRLPAAEFFSPLNTRLKLIFQIADSGFSGNLFGRIGLAALSRLRFAFEWLTTRFYPALAAFLLIILIILLTR